MNNTTLTFNRTATIETLKANRAAEQKFQQDLLDHNREAKLNGVANFEKAASGQVHSGTDRINQLANNAGLVSPKPEHNTPEINSSAFLADARQQPTYSAEQYDELIERIERATEQELNGLQFDTRMLREVPKFSLDSSVVRVSSVYTGALVNSAI